MKRKTLNGTLYSKNSGNSLSMNLQYGSTSNDVTNKLPTINIHNGKKVVYLGNSNQSNGLPPFKAGKYKPSEKRHRNTTRQPSD